MTLFNMLKIFKFNEGTITKILCYFSIIILIIPMAKKIAASIIVEMNKIFSAPLFVRKTSPPPPNIPERPAPLFCSKIVIIKRIATAIWIN